MKQGRLGGWSTLDWSGNDIINYDGTLYTAENAVHNLKYYIYEHDYITGTTHHDDFRSYTEWSATGHTIPTTLNSGLLHFGHEWTEKLIRSVSLAAETSGATYRAGVTMDGLHELLDLLPRGIAGSTSVPASGVQYTLNELHRILAIKLVQFPPIPLAIERRRQRLATREN